MGSLQDGGFVVTWRDDSSGSGDIFARQYDASGNPVGDEFKVNTWTANWQDVPKVQGLSDGVYVIVWHSYGDDGTSSSQIAGQRYDADGNPMSGEFIINTNTASDHYYPSIDLRADGALVVTWQDGSNNQIQEKIITSFDSQVAAKDLLGGDG